MQGSPREVKTEVVKDHKYLSNKGSKEWAEKYAQAAMQGKEPKKEITTELIETTAKSIMEQYMRLKEEINVSLSNKPSQKILEGAGEPTTI
eukprot:CAMPEP_0202978684 /NCGR_PEP_ID=MMETSP1396-20130829/85033_1 /ASSEMBLY_ACC=CAM_ASM_000872 /TAXON_ID= /ORGANISM="Pseudokeronopsis sp., Strain Brazil" /LENGTH=90 /DNA_ID=CAMNT_0049717753 /DNA_START=1592 /DNA_END=1864 /DNA_ORIENTATION=+